MTTVHAGELPVDELPNGLPLFNVFLHLPAVEARLQVFRVVRSYTADRATVHTVLVHPQDVDAVGALGGALAFFQLHGEIWVLRAAPRALTLGRIDRGAEYAIARSPDGRQVCLSDPGGRPLAAADRHDFARDDLARVRILCAGFLTEYDDDALSVPLVRAYPGRTSLIVRGRRFPRLFIDEPVGPGTEVDDPWAYLGDAVPGGSG